MTSVKGNGITNRIVDYFYNKSEQGIRELVLGVPLEFIDLQPDFPYYLDGIRRLEFDGNMLSKLYVSLSFLSNKDFLYYYKTNKIYVIDYDDYDPRVSYFLYPNLNFLNIKESGLNRLYLCMINTTITYKELRSLDFDIISLYHIDNPHSNHINSMNYSFSSYISHGELDYEEICKNFIDDLIYLFGQFSISGSFTVMLDGISKSTAFLLLFLGSFINSFELLDESLKLMLKNHLQFTLYRNQISESLKYLNPDLYNKFKSMFKCYF